MQRNYSKPHSFKDRLLEVLSDTKIRAEELQAGPEQDVLLEKIRQLETAIDLNDYLTTPMAMPKYEKDPPARS
jgi:hypothetical protein